MERFGRTVLAAVLGEPTPEDGYAGEYIQALADRVRAAPFDGEPGGVLEAPRDEQLAFATEMAYALQLGEIQASLVAFNRSEEHTSELQSLMRISYAVFCLKKTKSQTQ